MAGEIQKTKIETVRDLLSRETVKQQLAMAAPRHLTPDRIIRVAMTSIQRNPKLAECTPESLLGSLMTCTQLGLEPDSAGQKAHLIPYKTKGIMACQLVLGYRGLTELARRSESLRGDIDSAVVYAADRFTYRLGTAKELNHVPASGDRGRPIGAYAIAFFKDGGFQFEYLDIDEIKAIRGRSSNDRNAKEYDKESIWDTDWDAMARKSAIRRLCKYLPSSNELSQALALEDAQDQALPTIIDQVDIQPVGAKMMEKVRKLNAAPETPAVVPEPEVSLTATSEAPVPTAGHIDAPKCSEELALRIVSDGQRLAKLSKKEAERIQGQFGLTSWGMVRELSPETANDVLIEIGQVAR